MKKTAILLTLTVLISATAAAQTQQAGNSSSLSFLPGDLFYPVESFVEELEVEIAGVIGGPDFKSKAIANNADEALKEAKALADDNRSEKAAKMVDRYSQLMNKSQSLAVKSNEGNLSEKLQNISEKNVETLEQVREKVPEQARKGIDNAINRSKSKKGLINKPEANKIPKGGKDQQGLQNRSSGGDIPIPENKSSQVKKNLSSNLTEKPETEGKTLNSSNSPVPEPKNNSSEEFSPSEDIPSENESNSNKNENPVTGIGSGLL